MHPIAYCRSKDYLNNAIPCTLHLLSNNFIHSKKPCCLYPECNEAIERIEGNEKRENLWEKELYWGTNNDDTFSTAVRQTLAPSPCAPTRVYTTHAFSTRIYFPVPEDRICSVAAGRNGAGILVGSVVKFRVRETLSTVGALRPFSPVTAASCAIFNSL